MYDVIIIGGGPAGVAAGVYCARKKLKTLFIAGGIGGQSQVSNSVENWVGIVSISGLELSKRLEEHLRAQTDIEILVPEWVKEVKEQAGGLFEVVTAKETRYQTKTLIIVSGGRRRRLNVPGEDKFEGKGVVFCSTCDAPLFRNKKVVVVGAGNAGLEAVEDLIPYASAITLLARGSEVKGDPLTYENLKKSSKVSFLYNAGIQEILGEKFVSGIRYLDSQTKKETVLPVEGVFVEVGSAPNSDLMKDLVTLNDRNEILIDHKTAATSRTGVFAAGDVTDEMYKQNNISAGDGVKAALSAYQYLLKLKRETGPKV